MNSEKVPKIRVLVRKRPLNKKQQFRNQTDIIQIENNQTVVVRQQKLKVDLTPYIDQYRFNFDGAYDQKSTNEQIYLTSVRPLVDCAFDGAKVSCFAYGQTGSGKTYTMLGDGSKIQGLYLLAAYDIFKKCNMNSGISVWVSFYQIYCGKLYDLLNQKNILHARQDAKNNVNIVGLSQRKIGNVQNLMQVIQFGTGIRVTSQNGTNLDSSRSHAILQISLKQGNKQLGKISFIDLAGSERAADHADQLQKQTRIDGAQINKSLLALKQCIRALDQNKNHTPFRGSKLTMVLKDSFTGYCRTVMIGNISPNSSSSQNTLNTLKYADRVKQLKKPNKQNQLMQLDNLDRLSKQLMLPRQMVNHYKHNSIGPIKQIERQNQRQNDLEQFNSPKLYKPVKYTQKKISVTTSQNHSNLNRESSSYTPQYNNLMEKNSKSFHTKPKDPINNLSSGGKVKRSPVKHSPNKTNYNNSSHNNYNNNLNHQHFHSYQQSNRKKHRGSYQIGLGYKPYLGNSSPYAQKSMKFQNLPIQQNQPQDFQTLSKQHQQYISLILQQQQQLMKAHQRHIYTTIQSVKQQMLLMNEADKIGSSIQDYIGSLQHVLDMQANSIKQIQSRIIKLKTYLKQSKKIEEKYVAQSNKLYQDQDSLLADQEQLFS